jgi:hypothetical protein
MRQSSLALIVVTLLAAAGTTIYGQGQSQNQAPRPARSRAEETLEMWNLIRRVSGSNLGPDFGPGDNPTRDVFKTKADVVKFVQEAVADGARVIQQQGDAGLDNTSKFLGNRLAHNSSIWTFAIEHSGEHYGQLVVYYRANNLVPPASRR